MVSPIDIAGERLGTLVMYRLHSFYDIEDIILLICSTVVGLEIMRSINEENSEELRKSSIVKSAVGTLSFLNRKLSSIFSTNWMGMKYSCCFKSGGSCRYYTKRYR